jgi:hypothetical protein
MAIHHTQVAVEKIAAMDTVQHTTTSTSQRPCVYLAADLIKYSKVLISVTLLLVIFRVCEERCWLCRLL